MPVSPFPCSLREASLRRLEATARFSYGFTGSAASTIWFSEKFYKFEKNRKTVALTHVVGGIAQSPHGHRAKADPRTGSVRFPDLHAEAAETGRQLH